MLLWKLSHIWNTAFSQLLNWFRKMGLGARSLMSKSSDTWALRGPGRVQLFFRTIFSFCLAYNRKKKGKDEGTTITTTMCISFSLIFSMIAFRSTSYSGKWLKKNDFIRFSGRRVVNLKNRLCNILYPSGSNLIII